MLLSLAPCRRVNVFSIGKHFSDVWSTPKVDCGFICWWVFFHWYRQTQLSGLCLPTTGMDFQGDRTMAGTETRKLSPWFLKAHSSLSSHTHAVLQVYRLLRNGSRAGLLQWTLDTVFRREGSKWRECWKIASVAASVSSLHSLSLRQHTLHSRPFVLLFFHESFCFP